VAYDFSLILYMVPHVFEGSKFGSLSEKVNGSPRIQGFVIDVGKRVRSGFCLGHLKEKAIKRKRKEEMKV